MMPFGTPNFSHICIYMMHFPFLLGIFFFHILSCSVSTLILHWRIFAHHPQEMVMLTLYLLPLYEFKFRDMCST